MIVTTAQIKAQLNLDDAIDDTLVDLKAKAAQNHIERLLGYKIEEQFGSVDQEEIPPSLIEAVLQLAAHWYENREASGEETDPILFGVNEIVREYREYSF